MNWDTLIAEYCAAARVAFLALRATIGVTESGDRARQPRRGAGRTPDGRRIVWRFHGAGVYIKVAGQFPVDFDFGDRPDEASTDTWKIATAMRVPQPTSDEMLRLVGGGLVTNGKIRFALTTDQYGTCQ